MSSMDSWLASIGAGGASSAAAGAAAPVASSASSVDASLTPQERAFLELCRQHPAGLTDDLITGMTLTEKANTINGLSRKGLIHFLRIGTQIAYQETKSTDAARMANLNPDEKLIYLLIKQADNKGIWTRDIRNKSNLQQTQVTKILKSLESRKVIKSVKSVESKNKKLYMLYEIEPSRAITGGAWYSEQEFDSVFIDMLQTQCFKFIASKSLPRLPGEVLPISHPGFPKAQDVAEFITRSGVSKVALNDEDIESILTTLVYDGKIERLPHGAYRALRMRTAVNGLTDAPCGVCPMFSFCSDSGPVTPFNCEYYTKWLEML